MVEAKQHSQPQWWFLVWQRRWWVALATLFILVWWLVPPLLYRHTRTAKDAKLKAITDTRTALLAGLIGVGALLTFWLNRQVYRITARTLEVTEQGQVTDRYTRAVEQLGHEKAPVRLGALYSLERLAQDNPEHRQTVIDVFCAYLRMHYTPPAHSEPGTDQVEEAATAEDGIPAGHSVSGQNPTQEEHQVRQTAQRILAAHLQLPPGTLSAAAQRCQPSPRRAFWPGMSLDLTGAALVDFDFQQISVMQGWFDGATFQGAARFDGATFHSRAGFSKAVFEGNAGFLEATFEGNAAFWKAAFEGNAGFRKAAFKGNAVFLEATFKGDTWFSGATFNGEAGFRKAAFKGETGFTGATFKGDAGFREAAFKGEAVFGEAIFEGEAGFRRAAFERKAVFSEATFRGDAWFRGAIFEGAAWFDNATFTGDRSNQDRPVAGALVLHVDNPDLNNSRVWPDGYTVRPERDLTRGTLVRAGQAEEPEPAVPPSDETGP